MNKKYYAVVMCMKDGKKWAYVCKFMGTCNIAKAFDDPRIVSANICDTQKKAFEIMNAWNEQFQDQGVYAY